MDLLSSCVMSPCRVKVKCSRYRPSVAQRVGRGIALLFHDHGTRRGWVVSSTPRPHFTPGKDPVPILQEAGWAPGPVWTCGKSRPHRNSIPYRPARSQSLYRLIYPAHCPCRDTVIFQNKLFTMSSNITTFYLETATCFGLWRLSSCHQHNLLRWSKMQYIRIRPMVSRCGILQFYKVYHSKKIAKF